MPLKRDTPSSYWDPSARNAFKRALEFREELDLPNALLLFESVGADFEHHHKQAQDLAIAAGIPAFFSAFLPKSGGTFLHNSLVRMGALEIFNATQSPIDHYQTYLVDSWLRVFLRGGSTCHTHMLPTPYNLQMMRKVGASRIWIHVRDPRQTALSAYWHGQGEGQGRGEIAKKRLAEEASIALARRVVEAAVGNAPYQDLPFEEQLRWQFAWAHQWVADWIRASEACSDFAFLFTSCEDMVHDRDRFERSVFDFFEFEKRPGQVFGETHPEDRFRLGQTAEWRSVYSRALCEWMAQQLNPAVYARMGWEI